MKVPPAVIRAMPLRDIRLLVDAAKREAQEAERDAKRR